MSTRSYICKFNNPNELEYLYCHFDGYFSGVGSDLTNLCTSKEKVERLFEYGDLDSVDEAFNEKMFKERKENPEDFEPVITTDPWKWFEKVKEDVCIEYLHVWIPVEMVSKEFFEKFGIRNTRTDVGSEGVWVSCENGFQRWWFTDTLSKRESFCSKIKLGDFMDENGFHFYGNRRGLKKEFIYEILTMEGDDFSEIKKFLTEKIGPEIGDEDISEKFEKWIERYSSK